MAEGARLESVFTRKGNVGSNPTLSARLLVARNLPTQAKGRLEWPPAARTCRATALAGRIFKRKVQSRTAVECRRQIPFIARKRILHDRLNV